LRAYRMEILFWDVDAGDGQGAWVEMPTLVTGNRAITLATRTGMYVLVINGQRLVLDCTTQPVSTFALADGSRVSIPCGAGEAVTVAPVVNWGLPADLPQGYEYVSGLSAIIYMDGAPVQTLPVGDLMTIFMDYPVSMENREVVIMRWDGMTWTPMPTMQTDDGFASTESDETGIYALAVKLDGDPCAEWDAYANLVQAECGVGNDAAYIPLGKSALRAMLPLDADFVMAWSFTGQQAMTLSLDEAQVQAGYRLLIHSEGAAEEYGEWQLERQELEVSPEGGTLQVVLVKMLSE